MQFQRGISRGRGSAVSEGYFSMVQRKPWKSVSQARMCHLPMLRITGSRDLSPPTVQAILNPLPRQHYGQETGSKFKSFVHAGGTEQTYEDR